MLSVGVVNGYKSQVEFSIKVVKSFSLFVELLLFHQIDFTIGIRASTWTERGGSRNLSDLHTQESLNTRV